MDEIESQPQSAQSVFVVADYYDSPYFSILRFDKEASNYDYEAILTGRKKKTIKKIVGPNQMVVRINRNPMTRWLLSPPTSCNDHLYMLPHSDSAYDGVQSEQSNGYKLDFRTGSLIPIKSSLLPTNFLGYVVKPGHVVNLKGKFYVMVHEPDIKNPYFVCYNPENGSQKALQVLPYLSEGFSIIVGTAVWGDDTILFNVRTEDCRLIWAYQVEESKWYPVHNEFMCSTFEGEAVFVQDTIYALSSWYFDVVLALSIVKEESNFRCILKSQIKLDMLPVLVGDPRGSDRTSHLVHLGEDDFCVVQSCQKRQGHKYLPVQLTYINIKERSAETVLHHVEITDNKDFRVFVCFPLSHDRTNGWLKRAEALVFNLHAVEDSESETVQEHGGQGHITNLPIKRAGIQDGKIKKDKQDSSSFGKNEFKKKYPKKKKKKNNGKLSRKSLIYGVCMRILFKTRPRRCQHGSHM